MLNQKYLLAIVSLFALCTGRGAYANHFPYSAAGLRWSKTLSAPPGRPYPGFTHGCVKLDARKHPVLDQNKEPIFNSEMCTFLKRQVVVADSEAASACAKIGGKLPTDIQYKQLIRSLKPGTEFTEERFGPWLTVEGVAALSNLFGGEDIANNFYWTSVVRVFWDSESAYFMYGDNGQIGDTRRDGSLAVRCVRKI